MSRGFNDASEVLKLKKELGHARAQIQDLQDELTEKTNLYIKAISVSNAIPYIICDTRTEINTERN
jgi:hypothetical protein